jgi:metal-responsive CopG/Arc/MetJ family transcriptional regulator
MKAPKPKERQYVNVLFDEDALKKIDDFRFKHRFPSRTEAIRWLVSWSLKQNPKPEA